MTPPAPSAKTPPSPPALDDYNYGWAEAALLDGLHPANDETSITALLNLFRTLAYNAHKRRLTDENFAEAMNHVCDVHLLAQKLENAVILQQKLKKRGETTPNLDKTIVGLINALRSQRAWAVEHVKLVRQCALPGIPIQ